MKRAGVVATLLLLSIPRGAGAQSFVVSPFVDTTLSSPTGTGGSSKAGFGVAFGKLGRVVGLETEVTYHPEIVDNAANGLAKSHVLTLSENLVVGPTIAHVKPYGVIGAGDLHLNATSIASVAVPTPESTSNNYFTIDVGGGVAYFFNKSLGARGDLRYIRAYGLDLDDLEASGLTFNRFEFWRAFVGATFRF
jgi:Outer membrane protein beta-barrel domain